MKTFKESAYEILKEAGKPLHSKEITQRVLKKGLISTEGKTPEATMSAQLIVDINSKQDRSMFIKTAPSTFGINPNYKPKASVIKKEISDIKYKISRLIYIVRTSASFQSSSH